MFAGAWDSSPNISRECDAYVTQGDQLEATNAGAFSLEDVHNLRQGAETSKLCNI